jgi:NAD-dependent dihydropyrimidine dehydrogenase PreA subunit
MTYVVALPCIDTLDRACIDACPVDCIYEGNRTVYIHPDECIDCGACEAVCPVLAIYEEDALPIDYVRFAAENAAFFSLPLPGADRPLGSPGGAAPIGAIGIDTPWIATLPARPRLSW